MKTAVQKLKDEVFKLLDGVTLKGQLDNLLLNTFFDSAEEKEKEQIQEWYAKGWQEATKIGIEEAHKYQDINQNK